MANFTKTPTSASSKSTIRKNQSAKQTKQNIAAQKPAPKTATTIKSASGVRRTPQAITPEQRWNLIAEAAYLRAERRGFVGGNSVEDWLAAEKEIDRKLMQQETGDIKTA